MPPQLLRHLLLLRRPFPSSHPFPAFRSFSFSTSTSTSTSGSSAVHPLAPSLAAALLQNLPPSPTLDHFEPLIPASVPFSTALLSDVLSLSPSLGRSAIPLLRFVSLHRGFCPCDRSLSLLVSHLARSHDFPAVRILLSEFRSDAGPLSFREAVSRLSRAGRPSQAATLFRSMDTDIGLPLPRDRPALLTVISALADHGHARVAEDLVREWKDQIFPDEPICHEVVRGWCVAERPDEAVRVIGELRRGGFEVKATTYNALLDCVCRLSRKKDPLRMKEEAEKVLVEMEVRGVPRDSETFRVLIVNLCKIRSTEDAIRQFDRMSEWGCSPCAETYIALIRSLYQAARLSEGDEMVKRMRAAGFKAELDTKVCYGFLKILCGIERVEHSVKVFKMLKMYGFKPGVQTYELLMERLCAHDQVEKANALFRQAKALGLPVTVKEYSVDPRYSRKKIDRDDDVDKKKKKRLTMPEKILKKRRRLMKLRFSFVKKPRKRRRRAV